MKIEDDWEEGFCMYCSSKVPNVFAAARKTLPAVPKETGPSPADRIFAKICDALSDAFIKDSSDIEKIRMEILAETDMSGADNEISRIKYAKELIDISRMIEVIPYEMTHKVWTCIKVAGAAVYRGCAVCMMYRDYAGAFLVSVEKLSDLEKMKWDSVFRKPTLYGIRKADVEEVRKRTSRAERWLKSYIRA